MNITDAAKAMDAGKVVTHAGDKLKAAKYGEENLVCYAEEWREDEARAFSTADLLADDYEVVELPGDEK